jgi:hypothetical protein
MRFGSRGYKMKDEKKSLTNPEKCAISTIKNFLKLAQEKKAWGMIAVRVRAGKPTLIEFHQTHRLPITSEIQEG